MKTWKETSFAKDKLVEALSLLSHLPSEKTINSGSMKLKKKQQTSIYFRLKEWYFIAKNDHGFDYLGRPVEMH
jgi:hypothetical protein